MVNFTIISHERFSVGWSHFQKKRKNILDLLLNFCVSMSWKILTTYFVIILRYYTSQIRVKADQLPCSMVDQLSVLQKEKATLSNTLHVVSSIVIQMIYTGNRIICN